MYETVNIAGISIPQQGVGLATALTSDFDYVSCDGLVVRPPSVPQAYLAESLVLKIILVEPPALSYQAVTSAVTVFWQSDGQVISPKIALLAEGIFEALLRLCWHSGPWIQQPVFHRGIHTFSQHGEQQQPGRKLVCSVDQPHARTGASRAVYFWTAGLYKI